MNANNTIKRKIVEAGEEHGNVLVEDIMRRFGLDETQAECVEEIMMSRNVNEDDAYQIFLTEM